MLVATVSLHLHSDFLIFMDNCALAQETISVLGCTMISSLTGYINKSYFLMQNIWRTAICKEVFGYLNGLFIGFQFRELTLMRSSNANLNMSVRLTIVQNS